MHYIRPAGLAPKSVTQNTDLCVVTAPGLLSQFVIGATRQVQCLLSVVFVSSVKCTQCPTQCLMICKCCSRPVLKVLFVLNRCFCNIQAAFYLNNGCSNSRSFLFEDKLSASIQEFCTYCGHSVQTVGILYELSAFCTIVCWLLNVPATC